MGNSSRKIVVIKGVGDGLAGLVTMVPWGATIWLAAGLQPFRGYAERGAEAWQVLLGQ